MEYYLTNHMWNVQEIAAEDYVYLMGSELAHRTIDYLDTKELVEVYSRNESEYDRLAEIMLAPAYNSTPHENPVLRSPNQVPGLAEYYYSFISDVPPLYTEVVTTDLNITIESDGEYGYEVKWSQYYTGSDTMYTLMVYDMYDNVVKIVKTTTGYEPGVANIGTHVAVNNMMEYTVSDELPSMEFARFRVVTVLPDNTAFYSEPFDVKFT